MSVFVNAGSRNEDLETSGAAYLLERTLLRGTSNKTKGEIAQDIENLGARYGADTGREITKYALQVFKGDVGKAVKILGDLLSNSTIDANELELLKEEVSHEHEDNHHRYQETLLENAHYNVYREHMLGQPKKGDRDNVFNIKTDHLRDFHSTNYFGDNLVVVGAGNINHEEFVGQVDKHFASLPKQST